MAKKPDPVTQEILRSSLNAAAEEMKLNLIRTSHSTLIYEILDSRSVSSTPKVGRSPRLRGFPFSWGTWALPSPTPSRPTA